jgi:hypothetical protein
MSRPAAYLIQPNIQRLPNLLRDVREGEIRIPRFQRPFVWTPDQRLLLFQSIYEGMPIGSFLIWRTKENDLRCYDHLGPLRLAWASRDDEQGTQGIRQYLLDGHQRLTTLYVALGEDLSGGDQGLNLSDLDSEDEEENWPIFFDLEERAFRINTKRNEPPDTWLPLYILFDPAGLYEFQKRLLDRGADRALVNRAESLASTFKDYSIPVVPIVTEDLELATESFQRVNSGGTRMTEVHMVSALTWSPEFDLNERMREIRLELGEVGWEELEEKMILNTCKAALDLDIYYADTQEVRKALKERPEVLQEATDSLKTAARFLREQCKVYGPAILPYSFQIVLLADALRVGVGSHEGELSPSISEALRRWFWLTTYTEHFAGISAVRLARTLGHLRDLATHGGNPEPPGLVRRVAFPRRFDFRAARSRAIALRLADLQADKVPRDPHQLLAEHGRNAMPMLIPSKELPQTSREVEGPENRVLIPPKEASELRRAFGVPGTRWSRFDRARAWSRFLDEEMGVTSHVPHDLKLHLLESGLSWEPRELLGFLMRRRDRLRDLEQKFVESLGLRVALPPG